MTVRNLFPARPSTATVIILLLGLAPISARGSPVPEPPAPPAAPQNQPPQERLTVGVIDLEANGVDPGEARAISERLRIWLGRTQTFQVIERNQMESIMEEMGFQFSGACDTDECVVQVGRVLGASKMVAGSVSRVGTLYSLQIRIIDITTSRIEHTAFKDEPGGIEAVLTVAAESVANELAANVSGQAVQPAQQPTQPAVTQPGAARITTANVRVESNPAGATITHAGNSLGLTPATIVLPEGSQQLMIELEGYRPKTQPVNVIAGREQTVTVRLEEIPTGFLTIATDPIQCEVFIDGRNVGRSPLSRHRTYEGSHEVEVRREGYESQTRQVTIAPRQTEEMEFTLRRSGAAQLTFRSTLNGARVSITGDEALDAALTNPDQSVPLPPGSYTLTVKAKGYASWQRQVTLADGANEVVPITLRPKSRIAAGLLSLIPGMGQFYSRRPMMGLLMLGGVAGSAAYTMMQQSTYDELKQEYLGLQEEYSNATTSADITRLRTELNDKYQEMRDSYDSMSSTAMIMTAVWAVNVLDAVALMPRLRPFAVGGTRGSIDLGPHQGRLALTFTLIF